MDVSLLLIPNSFFPSDFFLWLEVVCSGLPGGTCVSRRDSGLSFKGLIYLQKKGLLQRETNATTIDQEVSNKETGANIMTVREVLGDTRIRSQVTYADNLVVPELGWFQCLWL
jgi:hypothetical protein